VLYRFFFSLETEKLSLSPELSIDVFSVFLGVFHLGDHLVELFWEHFQRFFDANSSAIFQLFAKSPNIRLRVDWLEFSLLNFPANFGGKFLDVLDFLQRLVEQNDGKFKGAVEKFQEKLLLKLDAEILANFGKDRAQVPAGNLANVLAGFLPRIFDLSRDRNFWKVLLKRLGIFSGKEMCAEISKELFTAVNDHDEGNSRIFGNFVEAFEEFYASFPEFPEMFFDRLFVEISAATTAAKIRRIFRNFSWIFRLDNSQQLIVRTFAELLKSRWNVLLKFLYFPDDSVKFHTLTILENIPLQVDNLKTLRKIVADLFYLFVAALSWANSADNSERISRRKFLEKSKRLRE
jgi:hypothetical protein